MKLIEQLEKDLALCNKATPGPWVNIPVSEKPEGYAVEGYPGPNAEIGGPETYEDAEFIAASRTRWPATTRALIVALEALQSAQETLRSAEDYAYQRDVTGEDFYNYKFMNEEGHRICNALKTIEKELSSQEEKEER